MAMTERRLALSNLASRQTEPLNSGQSCWAGWAFSHSLGAVHFWLTDWRRPLHVGFGISDPFIVRARIKAKFKREIADKDPTVRAVAAEGLGVIGDRDVVPLLEVLAVKDPVCLAGQVADDGTGDLCP